MLAYWVSGEGYNRIIISIENNGIPSVTQFYVNYSNIVKRSVVKYFPCEEDRRILDSIITDDEDTIILPKGLFTVVNSFAVRDTKFNRIIVPLNMEITFKERALYGSKRLRAYQSLSRKVKYEADVFPSTIIERSF